MLDNITILQQTKEALDRAIAEKRISQEMVKNLSPAIIDILTPILKEIAQNSKITKTDILEVLAGIKINIPEIKVPEIKSPDINVKAPDVNVNVPEIKTDKIEKAIEKGLLKFKIPKIETPKIPEIKIPKIEIPEIKVPEANIKIDLPKATRDNPLPVILTDEDGKFYKALLSVATGGGGGRRVEIIKPENAAVFNVSMTNLNTEYSQTLPEGTVAMTFQCRGAYDIRFSYHTGLVATPTAPYMTLKSGMIYYETNLKLTGKILYLACGTAAQVVEIICYN